MIVGYGETWKITLQCLNTSANGQGAVASITQGHGCSLRPGKRRGKKIMHIFTKVGEIL